MRAAIYCRISADRDGIGLGVDRQEADCRQLAKRLGWDVASVHVDNDISAYSGKVRPEYRKMLDGIKNGEVDAVIAWHPDRLHRRAAELEDFVTLCEEHDTAVQTVQAGAVDLGTASGRMVARMLGAAAMHEIDHARERIKRAKSQAAAEGRWRGGPRPFGYEADGMNLREPEATLLRRAAEDVVAGRALGAVAREMKARGTRGSVIDGPRLGILLKRARNAGLIEVDGEVIGKAAWPALMPEDLWRAVCAVLGDPSRRTTPGPERRWLGSGIYKCGVCGEPLRVSKSNGRSVYRCRSSHVSRVRSEVDAYVVGVVQALLRRPDAAEMLAAKPDREKHRADVLELQALRARLKGFEKDYAAGDITGRQLRDATSSIEGQVAALDQRMAARMRRDALAELDSAPDPGAAFATVSLDRQRALLSELVRVTILPGKKGRPKGWSMGEPYSDLESIDIEPGAAFDEPDEE